MALGARPGLHNRKFVKSEDSAFEVVFSQLQNLQAFKIYALSVITSGNRCIGLLHEAPETVFLNLIRAARRLPQASKYLPVKSGEYSRLTSRFFSRLEPLLLG